MPVTPPCSTTIKSKSYPPCPSPMSAAYYGLSCLYPNCPPHRLLIWSFSISIIASALAVRVSKTVLVLKCDFVEVVVAELELPQFGADVCCQTVEVVKPTYFGVVDR